MFSEFLATVGSNFFIVYFRKHASVRREDVEAMHNNDDT
jgi:hypothetical protein